MEDQLLDTWNIHNRVNLYLLDAVPPDVLNDRSPASGQSVAEQFAHIHNARLVWLDTAGAPIPEDAFTIGPGADIDKQLLRRALDLSGRAIFSLIEDGLETGRIDGFEPHPVAFVGYLISYESHHRGEIGMTLTESGHPLDQKVADGLWEWGER